MTSLYTRASVLVSLATLTLGVTANAQTWNEVGDAGRDGVSAGQITFGEGALTTINGTLNVPTDVDLYGIRITDEALFRAEITAFAGPDPALFLFNADGTLQVFNDDLSLSDLLSVITSQGVFTNGVYFIAIGNLPNYPLTATSALMTTWNLWPGPDFRQRQSSGGILAGWDDHVGVPSDPFAAYSISLQGAEFLRVPAPGVVAMLGLGGLMASRRRRG
jgi:hypothetical protein